MALKKILGLGLLICDIMLIVWLISLVGLKQISWFIVSYIGFTLLVTTILLLLFGNYTNEVTWEEAYDKRVKAKKRGLWRLLVMLTVLVASILSLLYFPAWLSAFFCALIMVSFWLFVCQDFLYVIASYVSTAEDIIYESKWFKRLLPKR